MAQTSFEIDQKTADALDRLKDVYGVNSNAAVLKRALAIAIIASKHADEDNNIHMLSSDKDGSLTKELIIPQKF